MDASKPESQPFSPEQFSPEEVLKPQHTALLLVDLQNDFLDPKGFFAQHPEKGSIEQMQSILPHIQGLVDAAHKAKVPVIFTQGSEDVKFREDDPPGLWRASYWGEKDGDGSVNSERGTFGWEFNQIKPQEGDIVVEKHKWTAFDGKDKEGETLNQILALLEIKTLVIAGVVAETCVETTVRDAYDKGYLVVIPENSVGSNDPEQLQARMKYWRGGHVGKVFSEDEIKQHWPEAKP